MMTPLHGDEKCNALLDQVSLVRMGILNITPDSFSDGGQFSTAESALKQALDLCNDGAHIIDVGGVSTRPGAQTVSSNEEWKRVSPVLAKLKQALPAGVLVSLDTSSVEVAFRAGQAGLIDLINDVNASRSNAGLTEFTASGTLPADWTTADVAARFRLGLVLMHMHGDPQTMQLNPAYENCVDDIARFLEERLNYAKMRGVRWCAVDPGIGFGKTLEHNLSLLSAAGFARLTQTGAPILIGLSRKSFLLKLAERNGEHLSFGNQQDEILWRDQQSGTWENICAAHGARIIRTHKIKKSEPET
jgi:dihydropteroate synthase